MAHDGLPRRRWLMFYGFLKLLRACHRTPDVSSAVKG